MFLYWRRRLHYWCRLVCRCSRRMILLCCCRLLYCGCCLVCRSSRCLILICCSRWLSYRRRMVCRCSRIILLFRLIRRVCLVCRSSGCIILLYLIWRVVSVLLLFWHIHLMFMGIATAQMMVVIAINLTVTFVLAAIFILASISVIACIPTKVMVSLWIICGRLFFNLILELFLWLLDF